MSRGTLDPAALARLSLTGLSPSLAGLPRSILLALSDCVRGPKPRGARAPVWALPISLAATLEIDVSFFSSGYLDVSVHRVPFHTLWIHVWMTEVCSAGFPHSDICGSMAICASPQLFAAYHVFLRLLVPRHPPCALGRLTSLAFSAFPFASSVMLLGLCLVCFRFPGLCVCKFTELISLVNLLRLIYL